MKDEAQREYHEVAQIFPMMSDAEFEALKTDIAEHGQREPIWLDRDGRIVDGRNRHKACVELDITPRFETWNGQGSLVSFVVSLNLHRRHLTDDQRKLIAAKLATMPNGGDRKSDQSSNLNSDFVTIKEAADLMHVGRTGVAYAKRVLAEGTPELVAAVEAGDVAVSAAAEVATLPQEWQRVIVEHGEVAEAAKEIRAGKSDAVEDRVKPHVTHNSGNNEWYTPGTFIAAARAVLGGIDLDPSTSEMANEVVKADLIYTADDDGLDHQWRGRVWMNPPYSSDLVGKFVEKLTHHFKRRDVSAAVVLVNNATETQWFHQLAEHASAICFPKGRVRFWSPTGQPGAPLQGQAIVYLGGEADKFQSSFQQYGIIAQLNGIQ